MCAGMSACLPSRRASLTLRLPIAQHPRGAQGGGGASAFVASAFGAPSAFGASTSAFGAPRSGGASAFGAASTPSSAFGGARGPQSTFGSAGGPTTPVKAAAIPDKAKLSGWMPGQTAMSAEMLTEDLKQQNRPLWRLSCYGPARNEVNLRDGDLSPEELRLMAWEALRSGNGAQYVSTG